MNIDPLQKLRDAEILVADRNAITPLLKNLGPKLRWLQMTCIGTETIVNQLLQGFTPHFTITRMSGAVSAPVMTEYVIGHIIAQEREFFKVKEEQRNHIWYVIQIY